MKLSSKHVAVVLALLVLSAAGVAAIAVNRTKQSSRHPAEAVVPTTTGRESTPVAVAVPTTAPIVANTTAPAPTAGPAKPVTTVAATLTPLPANATAVPDDALLQLSNLVDLIHATTQPPDKQRWAQAVPAASKLMEGPCDCDQRNWLKHFVRMGNDALGDSPTEFAEEAQLLSTLRRNDTMTVSAVGKPN